MADGWVGLGAHIRLLLSDWLDLRRRRALAPTVEHMPTTAVTAHVPTWWVSCNTVGLQQATDSRGWAATHFSHRAQKDYRHGWRRSLDLRMYACSVSCGRPRPEQRSCPASSFAKPSPASFACPRRDVDWSSRRILAKRPSMSVRMHAEILIGPRKDDQVARWPRDVPRRACTTDSAETTSLVGCASGHKRRKCPSPILRYRAEAVALGSPACADDHERCRTSGVAD